MARAAEAAMGVCFAVLCSRFLLAAFQEFANTPWPVLALSIGGFGLGWWRPGPAVFAFTVLIPLLSGLDQTTLLGTSSLSLLFAAIWLGISAGRLRKKRFLTGKKVSFCPPAIILLIAAVLVSLLTQAGRDLASSSFASLLGIRSTLGYGNPYYFLTSAFIWLQGLFYFKEMNVICAESFSTNGEVNASNGVCWAKSLLIVHTLVMGGFVLFECLLHIPEGWAGAGLQSPYEDISSQGSIAVALLVFTASRIRSTPLPLLLGGIVWSSATLALLIASWSRGAWLAAICWLLLAAWYRFPTRWFTLMIVASASAVVYINLNADQASWQQNTYVSRLVQLVRVEGIASKSTGRLELWHKAVGMIKEHPVTGHGIGSFYLKSPRYARPDDPYAQIPDFAHNTLLQIAAEQGVPVALLFAGLCGWTLWLGFRMWLQDKERHSNPTGRSLLVLGLTLALGAYLQTQMTANSLNVYVSNQFFFWFLVAALLSLAKSPVSVPKKTEPTPQSG